MKKFLTSTLACIMLVCSLSVFATAENIIINDQTATIPEDMGKICEVDDRTFVPIRFIMEYLGCTVNYQETTHTYNDKSQINRTATITNPETNISYFMTVGDNKIFIITDQISTVQMDTTVFINEEEGRMYVPIRFLAQALGYNVDWDAETQTVSLVYAD